jgi:transcription elongation factor GreA
VVDVSKLSGDVIKFGATVTLVDEDTRRKNVWQIVGEAERMWTAAGYQLTRQLRRL